MKLENEIRHCLFCEVRFVPKRSNQLYCCKQHRNRTWIPIPFNCKFCGNETKMNKVNQEYCSSNCRQLQRVKDNYVNLDVPKYLFIGTRKEIVDNILAWAETKGFILNEERIN